MSKKAPPPAVERFEGGQIVTLEWERAHTQTHRYKFVGDVRKDTPAVDTVYVRKDVFDNPAQPPKRIRVGISFED